MRRTSLADLSERPQARPFPDAEPDVVRLALEAGDRVPPHTHPERRIIFHLLSGGIDLSLDGETHALDPGDVVLFDGRREVSPAAREDSEALLVLAER